MKHSKRLIIIILTMSIALVNPLNLFGIDMEQTAETPLEVQPLSIQAQLINIMSARAASDGITTDHWGVDYADFTINNDMVMCDSRSEFGPDYGFLRIEVVYALAKIHGVNPSDNVDTGFSDYTSGELYAGMVKWASDNGIVTGHTDGTFRATDVVTRQQLCTFIWRYMNKFGITIPVIRTGQFPFGSSDDPSETISSYALEAVTALYNADMISGYDDGTFRPQENVTTAASAKILTHAHAAKNNSSNAVNVYVKRKSNGYIVKNAYVYVYRPNTTGSGSMYPYDPIISNSSGYAKKTGITGNGYGVNAISATMGAASSNSLVSASYKYVFVNLETSLTYSFNPPLAGFKPIGVWQHSSACTADCKSRFGYICPTAYFDALYPQNFGWRYGTASQVEFHPAIDITEIYDEQVTRNTDVYSIFDGDYFVERARFIDNCGYTIQIKSNGIYATYMHLTSINDILEANEKKTISEEILKPEDSIGKVGNTETSAVHLHFSIGETDALSADTADEIATFINPINCYR